MALPVGGGSPLTLVQEAKSIPNTNRSNIMQLTITRNQADIKGLFGGHKGVSFSLSGQCSVSADEKALIERYKVGSYELAAYQMKLKGGTSIEVSITVDGIS